jgi:hypothetical protein
MPNTRTVGDFALGEGEEASFVLNWSPSFRAAPPPLSGQELTQACKQVHSFWTGWAAAFRPADRLGDAVLRSLLTLKALAVASVWVLCDKSGVIGLRMGAQGGKP